MKYIDEYRNKKMALKIADAIRRSAAKGRVYKFMEVCGTHTNTFFKFGLKSLLPDNIKLISGPGCPVCVTDVSYIDNAIAISKIKDVIVATFGDMIKVPGSESSLYRERSRGSDIRMVYSSLDALKIAEENPDKKIVFLAVGFETTVPTVALALLEAKRRRVSNFSVYSAHKLIPPAMRMLLKDKDVLIDGFILPAHVSAIIGADAYRFLKRLGIPGVIAGFEPLDMLGGIKMLVDQLNDNKADIEIQYNRVVRPHGNEKAQKVMDDVFSVTDASWRGFGIIRSSGLKIRAKYKGLDAEKNFNISFKRGGAERDKGCICADVLKGKKGPQDCRLFNTICNPENPKGPCMVSSEGSCGIYYKYIGRQAFRR